ncbi:Fic family protein [Puia dinghuensis]|uniref:Cell division protein Fic n=1 Tax=Puia dinghuensis TaxID=1792502 RepID=A0A8J2UHH1_9BACT|nr:Fic family protein [Puia dinghuensis]GGB18604.1 cell division protein Fic [Puia dinghuensis]
MDARPVGGQWLKEHFNLVNYTLTHSSYIANNASIRLTSKGNIEQDYGIKYAVTIENNVVHQIEFYLKYDDLNLDFLQAIFQLVPKMEIEAFIGESPAGRSGRKIGFWYEFLMGKSLTLNRSVSGNYIDLMDSDKYLTGRTEKNSRWRLNNNLLGTSAYCPIIRKTRELDDLLGQDLTTKLEELKANYPEDIFRRATNYLYTKETKSSYEIEKEQPSADRTQKFVGLLQMAGSEPNEQMLQESRLVALQNAIVDPRFAAAAFRNFQNYVGQSMSNGQEIFHYICPPPNLMPSLMEGLQALTLKTAGQTPAEARATLIAFGFVFVHPFEDGNGRLHRFLIHDVLAHDEKVPKGLIIPVSAHMLNHIREYDVILEKYSKPLMQRVKYSTSGIGEVEILNPEEIEGYFRYPDLTDQCIYLIRTIHETIREDMPNELTFVQRFDEAKRAVQQIVDMPDKNITMMLTFLHQNKGIFPKRRREYFEKLTDEEIQLMQEAYRRIYELD